MFLDNRPAVQFLHLMSLNNMIKNQSSCRFVIDSLVKQKGTTCSHPLQKIRTYVHLQTHEEYIKHTEPVRKSEPQHFISIIKPFKKVPKDTVGRWIKNVLKSSLSYHVCTLVWLFQTACRRP